MIQEEILLVLAEVALLFNPRRIFNNGFQNDLKHTRGVLSMARTNDPNSAGSQFLLWQQTLSTR